jgi:Bacterial PH domain
VSRFFRVAPFTAQVFINTLLFIGALAFFAIRSALSLAAGTFPDSFDLGASAALAIIIGYAWLRSVKGYRLAQGELVVERAGPGKLHIALESITSAEAQAGLGSFLRAGYLGIQGLFGWAGKAIVRKPTDLQSQQAEVYGTNPANAVVLHLQSGRMLIVTPADTERFVEALREAGVRAPSATGAAPRRAYAAGPARKKKARR